MVSDRKAIYRMERTLLISNNVDLKPAKLYIQLFTSYIETG